MPTADDLFRPTAVAADSGQPAARTSRARRSARATEPGTSTSAASGADAIDPGAEVGTTETAVAPAPVRTPSGRVRHDEKMTVYVTSDELLDLEHARLTLRRDQGLAVDRGRMVRAAIALALEDLEAHGDDSDLVRRLLAQ